jgi:hypothetical protein
VAGHGITTAKSEKLFKSFEHRRYRRAVRLLIMAGEEEIFPAYAGDFGNPWNGPKDGRVVSYWSLHTFLQTKVWETRSIGWCTRPDHHRHVAYITFKRPATVKDWIKTYIGK